MLLPKKARFDLTTEEGGGDRGGEGKRRILELPREFKGKQKSNYSKSRGGFCMLSKFLFMTQTYKFTQPQKKSNLHQSVSKNESYEKRK